MENVQTNQSKHIYILISGFSSNKGGVENVIIRYYRAMKTLETGLVFDLITYEKNPAYKEEIIDKGGSVITVPSPRHIDSKRAIKKFFKENAAKYQALWCNKCDLANIDYIKYASKYKIPIRVIHSHNYANMCNGWKRVIFYILHKKNKSIITKYATDFWACSDYAAEWMFPTEILNKVTYIPNAIDTSLYLFNEKTRIKKRKELGLEDCLIVGYVGRISYQKNPEFALDIFSYLALKVKNAVLLFVGSGDLENKIKAKAATISCSESIRFLGAREDVSELLQAVDILLLPSRFEGFPVIAVEAQTTGLPIYAASDGISKQTDLTGLVNFLPLSRGAEEWSNVINKNLVQSGNSHLNRDMYADIVIEEGFDIKRASKRLLNFFDS